MLSRIFKDGAPEDTIHVIVEQPKDNSNREPEKAICPEYPDREGGEAVITVEHCKGTPQHEDGRVERPSDDAYFRNIIQQYRKTNTKTITDFTLTEMNNL
ncbi:hypothetical protein BGZ80_004850 [Entomortierella chlamydospora]|uniref:Uncharacterized protein n=1 Tax=Entomortierella chlamydospora TaxID=101097 RepID=A0A9P6MMI5_9FUNG|nr:hypothetical protein BGZ80_004850 [Entomortierella chlamydospora]